MPKFLYYLTFTKFWIDACITDFINKEKKKKEVIFLFQFGFQEKYFTNHAPTNMLWFISDKVRHEIDEGNYACGIFVNFQNTFATVDHPTLLKKQEHYGSRVISSKWLASYLSNRMQFVSINGCKSNLVDATHWDIFLLHLHQRFIWRN